MEFKENKRLNLTAEEKEMLSSAIYDCSKVLTGRGICGFNTKTREETGIVLDERIERFNVMDFYTVERVEGIWNKLQKCDKLFGFNQKINITEVEITSMEDVDLTLETFVALLKKHKEVK